MNRIVKHLKTGVVVGALFLTWGSSLAKSAALTLSLLPGGSISGPAGSTVGWGYKITNSSVDWVETLNLTADVFTNGTPTSIFDYPVIGPNSSVTVLFSNAASVTCPSPDCGLFELAWDAGAPLGSTNSGTFTVTSEFFGTNPLVDPNALDLGPAPDIIAPYSATVSGAPEPSTYLLLVSGFVSLLILTKVTGVSRACIFSRKASLRSLGPK